MAITSENIPKFVWYLRGKTDPTQPTYAIAKFSAYNTSHYSPENVPSFNLTNYADYYEPGGFECK